MKLNNVFRKCRGKGFHIRYHILFSYLLLVGLSIILLWSTQTVFLKKFYETERISIAENAAESMREYFANTGEITADNLDTLTDHFDSIASDNELSYMLIDSGYRVIHESSKAMSHQFTRYEVDLLQTNANIKGGKYVTSAEGTAQDTKVVIICCVLSNEQTHQKCYLIINTLITPVKTTIAMLRKSTYLVTLLMIIISVIVALIMSKSLAKPIQNITESADKLAKGEYKTEFEGGRFSETRQLAKTLNYASSEISKIDELQRDLIANVSHDLRTPLTMIKGYAEMIRDISGDRKEKREEHLRIIIKETDRLAQLVNDILDLSKLENGRQTLNMSSFDISAKLHDIMERYREFSESNGYTLNYTDNPPVIVKCDIGKIEQVIYNLVNNAINYTGEDKQIFVTMETEDEFVKISVRDTGKGISEDNIHQIFEKYYRAEKTKREVVGTGLGLSIVRAVLKAHNFPFGVQSTPGAGTTFWFKIRRDKESICI